MSVGKNVNNFLNYSIESIIHQSFSNFEFIIINDGNNKEVQNIINDYIKIDDRIICKSTNQV